MLVEIPDPEIIFSVIVAFLSGLIGLYAFYKVRPLINVKNSGVDPSYLQKLEYYEKQLIDMKIRLDSLDIIDSPQKSNDSEDELKKILQKLALTQKSDMKELQPEPEKGQNNKKIPSTGHNNTVDYVLQLITEKPMTSRDIQVILGKSREHTSRLLKKFYDDGLVIRNEKAKPYTYSISEKGKERLGILEATPLN